MAFETTLKFSQQACALLKHYVYALTDPDTKEIFYVGKANANNRAFDHLKVPMDDSDKSQRISLIRSRKGNKQPLVEILRSGLDSEAIAFEVEAAIIDTLGLEKLTNQVRGHGVERGRMPASEVENFAGTALRASEVDQPYLLFFINRTYSPTQSAQERYDSIRQFWKVSKEGRDTNQYPFALGVVDGTVIAVYKILQWYPAGTTVSTRSYSGSTDDNNKWEFVGQQLHQHEYLGKTLIDDNGERIKANQIGFGYLPQS